MAPPSRGGVLAADRLARVGRERRVGGAVHGEDGDAFAAQPVEAHLAVDGVGQAEPPGHQGVDVGVVE